MNSPPLTFKRSRGLKGYGFANGKVSSIRFYEHACNWIEPTPTESVVNVSIMQQKYRHLFFFSFFFFFLNNEHSISSVILRHSDGIFFCRISSTICAFQRHEYNTCVVVQWFRYFLSTHRYAVPFLFKFSFVFVLYYDRNSLRRCSRVLTSFATRTVWILFRREV